jgi:hypothetical protein
MLNSWLILEHDEGKINGEMCEYEENDREIKISRSVLRFRCDGKDALYGYYKSGGHSAPVGFTPPNN